MNEKKELPKIVKWLLSRIISRSDFDNISGDFEELYYHIVHSKGSLKANFWIGLQILKSIPGFLSYSIYWRTTMFKKYFITAIRNVKKQKGYSFINIAGLTIGLTCFIFILFWVQNELSYDQFHKKKEQIFRILYKLPDGKYNWAISYALPPALKDEYHEIKEYARVWPWHRSLVKFKDKSFEEYNIYLSDPGFFKMFSFPFIHGRPETALPDKYSIVLTEDTAYRYFGNKNPLGKTLYLHAHDADFKVTGVIANIPTNSHLQFDMIGRVEWLGKERLARWSEWVAPGYVLLKKDTNIKSFNKKMTALYRKNIKQQNEVNPVLQSLTKVHLYELGQPGRIKKVYIFSIIALFILIMACVNFMNLSTARSVQRAKEVAMRKVVGASRSQIAKQFLGEAMFMSFLSMGLAILLVFMLFPVFNNFSGQKLSLHSGNSISILLMLLGTTLFTGFISGSYPAFFLSSFKPIQILRSKITKNGRDSVLRKILMVFQFSISICMLLCTIIVSQQLKFLQNRDLGLNREHVITIMNNPNLEKQIDIFKQEIKAKSGILNVTTAAQRPFQISQVVEIDWEGNDSLDSVYIGYTMVDYDFFKTFDIPIIQGRDFNQKFSTDKINACIINEKAAKVLNMENPIGFEIYFDHKAIDPSLRNLKIIGVVKDFNTRSMHRDISPFLFRIYRPWHQYIFIKIDSRIIPEALAAIKKSFKKHSPDYPFWYEFLDAAFNRQYTSEMELRKLFNMFCMLSIIVASLGLFGLTSFSTEQKTKEIGIRKVLGASITSIITLTGKEFIKWVAIANLFALPMGYYIMNQWLNNFVYKIGIGPVVFFISGGLSLLIALGTISYLTLKAAVANPVDSLRYE